MFDLTEVKDLNPFLISQGEKRRLSVVSVLVSGQKLLYLDEPTYGQDKRNTNKMM
ncbi:ATP-binding cassette domain-containing protein [Miniphocaeibacter massiliensis]|uniref:ATP-binding cassette domain-containing protein n=1 Tax=Miniphocaeibacter massiliensis TaxID=2041841 RepID=UPI003BF4876F